MTSAPNPRAHPHHPHRVEGVEATDSAGVTWGGRALSGSGFENDRGEADPRLRALLAAQAPLTEIVPMLQAGRVLVPIVAEPVTVDRSGPLAVDSHVEMAAVTLVAPDGTRALPVFSGVDALAQWDAAARPVPVEPHRAGEAALDEDCEVIVLDPAGPHPVVFEAPIVLAFAQRRPWEPPWRDPVVTDAVRRAAAAEPEVREVEVEEPPGQPCGIRVTLHLRPGLDRAGLSAVATRVGEALAADEPARPRVSAVAFRLR